MAVRDGGSAATGYAEIRQYCSAAAQALEDAGMPPGERWDEAGGTAFYWTEGDRALRQGPWGHGVVVFWGVRGGRRGWGCAPLDAAGGPALDAVTWLPVAPWVAPGLLVGQLRRLFAEGVEAPERAG
ncbi:hypothetical protein [Streptomyces sp. NPDC005435]|uniref:hypothetical protein n=1 Tax=Streptomyces sp. NPDC005435 TaxID=3154464 RepID=UPI0034523490